MQRRALCFFFPNITRIGQTTCPGHFVLYASMPVIIVLVVNQTKTETKKKHLYVCVPYLFAHMLPTACLMCICTISVKAAWVISCSLFVCLFLYLFNCSYIMSL